MCPCTRALTFLDLYNSCKQSSVVVCFLCTSIAEASASSSICQIMMCLTLSASSPRSEVQICRGPCCTKTLRLCQSRDRTMVSGSIICQCAASCSSQHRSDRHQARRQRSFRYELGLRKSFLRWVASCFVHRSSGKTGSRPRTLEGIVLGSISQPG